MFTLLTYFSREQLRSWAKSSHFVLSHFKKFKKIKHLLPSLVGSISVFYRDIRKFWFTYFFDVFQQFGSPIFSTVLLRLYVIIVPIIEKGEELCIQVCIFFLYHAKLGTTKKSLEWVE